MDKKPGLYDKLYLDITVPHVYNPPWLNRSIHQASGDQNQSNQHLPIPNTHPRTSCLSAHIIPYQPTTPKPLLHHVSPSSTTQMAVAKHPKPIPYPQAPPLPPPATFRPRSCTPLPSELTHLADPDSPGKNSFCCFQAFLSGVLCGPFAFLFLLCGDFTGAKGPMKHPFVAGVMVGIIALCLVIIIFVVFADIGSDPSRSSRL